MGPEAYPGGFSSLPCGAGWLGICGVPGRSGDYHADLAALLTWRPDMVLTMIPTSELEHAAAHTLGRDLTWHGIGWRHLPIADFGVPGPDTLALWPGASRAAQQILWRGGRVLTHCFGGCGRSGMALLRLMIEMGVPGPQALLRLRQSRPCAVETDAQLQWAFAAGNGGKG